MKKYFHHRSLWRINCDSVSRGVAIGLFAAAIPLMPFQMVIAAFLAIIIRANLPISVAVSWISNPFTLVPKNITGALKKILRIQWYSKK